MKSSRSYLFISRAKETIKDRNMDTTSILPYHDEDSIPDVRNFKPTKLISYLMEALNHEDTKKALSPFGFLDRDAPKPEQRETLSQILTNIDDAISGVRPDLDLLIWTEIFKIDQHYYMDICPISYDLISHTGLNAGPIILISMIKSMVMGGTVLFECGPGAVDQEGFQVLMQTSCPGKAVHPIVLIDGTIGFYKNTLSTVSIPQTIISAVEGESLRKLISHPVLDRYNITIESIDMKEIMNFHADVTISHDINRISLSDLCRQKMRI